MSDPKEITTLRASYSTVLQQKKLILQLKLKVK